MKRKLIISACVVALAWCVTEWTILRFDVRIGDTRPLQMNCRGFFVTYEPVMLEISRGWCYIGPWKLVYPNFDGGYRAHQYRLFVPYWCVAVAAVGVILIASHRKKAPPGHCACGYDLTGNVSGICPECGKALAAAEGK